MSVYSSIGISFTLSILFIFGAIPFFQDDAVTKQVCTVKDITILNENQNTESTIPYTGQWTVEIEGVTQQMKMYTSSYSELFVQTALSEHTINTSYFCYFNERSKRIYWVEPKSMYNSVLIISGFWFFMNIMLLCIITDIMNEMNKTSGVKEINKMNDPFHKELKSAINKKVSFSERP